MKKQRRYSFIEPEPNSVEETVQAATDDRMSPDNVTAQTTDPKVQPNIDSVPTIDGTVNQGDEFEFMDTVTLPASSEPEFNLTTNLLRSVPYNDETS